MMMMMMMKVLSNLFSAVKLSIGGLGQIAVP